MLIKILRIKFAQYTSLVKHTMYRLMAMLLSPQARPLRFMFTGGLCGFIQLTLFALLIRSNWLPLIANSISFLISAQVNFLFSMSFTWGDRLSRQPRKLLKSWLTFHGSILGTALLNQMVFLLGHLLLPNLFAAVLGIGVAALVNFVLLDRQVFQQHSKTEQELESSNICGK